MADQIEANILQTLSTQESIADSGEYAASLGVDHMAVVGVVKSLGSSEMIIYEVTAVVTC